MRTRIPFPGEAKQTTSFIRRQSFGQIVWITFLAEWKDPWTDLLWQSDP